LVSKTVKWSWTDEQQNAFDMMKTFLSCEALLSYPDFSKLFDVDTDASHPQIGAVISQEQRPIAFYSRKFTTSSNTLYYHRT
jgi:RNase H-like domain found in reverse transcriptase